jgi:hypothetical protein
MHFRDEMYGNVKKSRCSVWDRIVRDEMYGDVTYGTYHTSTVKYCLNICLIGVNIYIKKWRGCGVSSVDIIKGTV